MLKCTIKCVCFILSATLVPYVNAAGCTLTLPKDLPPSEPVLLHSSDGIAPYELFKPTDQINKLAIGSKLLLVCAGNSNAIDSLKLPSLELKCTTGGVFKDDKGVLRALKNLGCTSTPTPTLRRTITTCADNRGYFYEAGFVYNTNQFARVFLICRDFSNERTLYTVNYINGAAIQAKVKGCPHCDFRAEGIKFNTATMYKFYSKENQITRFEALFGKKQDYINSTMFMAKGHLTPDADFVFSYEQAATYFYSNAAPEFQVINAANWIRVENIARSLEITRGKEMEIYNGYMGILNLRNRTSGILLPIYLDGNNEIVVPRYFFKVIHSVTQDAAIVMITLNNPFADAADIDEFCTNVCDAANINSPYFTDRRRGYTFCCELKDFKKHYPQLPAALTASNLLKSRKRPRSASNSY